MNETGSVLHLFRKRAGASGPEPEARLRFSASGLEGSKSYSPLRQVLITAASDIHELGYLPGELHENVVIDFPRLQDLASGSVLAIGDALIRLTFHCEPCSIIQKPGRSLKPLIHRRGVLGKYLNEGVLHIGDSVSISERKAEFIPYESRERIAWFLERHKEPIRAADLLFEVGLPSAYARALPAILRKLPSISPEQVVFASKTRGQTVAPRK
jgi:hypothetical protein